VLFKGPGRLLGAKASLRELGKHRALVESLQMKFGAIAMLLAYGVLAASPAHAQSLAEASEAAQKVHHDWPLSGNTGPKAAAAEPAIAVSAAVRNDPTRQAAQASLHAVQSVLAGGANASEFKKYYLDAKVKVDTLPQIPENTPIRAVTACGRHDPVAAVRQRCALEQLLDATRGEKFDRGLASVECIVLSRQYLHLAHLVGVA
jgi:hypothetical protein